MGWGEEEGAGGGGGGEGAFGWDVPPKRVPFSESVWDGAGLYSSVQIQEWGSFPERDSCMSEKGLLSYLCLELESHK